MLVFAVPGAAAKLHLFVRPGGGQRTGRTVVETKVNSVEARYSYVYIKIIREIL